MVNKAQAIAVLILLLKSPIFSQEVNIYNQITNSSRHQAFTSLTNFKNEFFLVFRDGSGHESRDGDIVLWQSKDGLNYEHKYTFHDDGFELRDPKIISFNDSILILSYLKRTRGLNDEILRTNIIRKSLDGINWTSEKEINYDQYWLWSLTHNNSKILSAGHRPFPWDETTRSWRVSLFELKNFGKSLERLIDLPFNRGYPNETDIVFNSDSTILAVTRNEFRNFVFSQINFRKKVVDFSFSTTHEIGGPKLFKIDGEVFLASRLHNPFRTSILKYNPINKLWTEVLELPSNGDTGYPGVVVKDDFVYLSYYATINDKTDVFVARFHKNELRKNGNTASGFALLDEDSYIFPNPTYDKLSIGLWHLNTNQINLINIRILDAQGVLLFDKEIDFFYDGTDEILDLDLSFLSKGNYFIYIKYNDNQIQKRLIKL